MLAIGCTGGIGAGKSTVSRLLANKGAIVVDADAQSRRALEPGSSGLAAVRERFGEAVFAADGALDRSAVAAIVFSDVDARRDLEAIVHPFVEKVILDTLTEYAGSDAIVVLDVALLIERDGRTRYGLDGVIVVDAPEEQCVERLVADRGMTESDARARFAAQLDRFERLPAADFVIMNIGTRDELAAMADEAWTWIARLREETGR